MTTQSQPVAAESIELAITGMTCASCANRIERKLNKLDGVTATVNYATEKAKVTYPDDVTPEDLVTVVEQAGYGAALPPPPAQTADRSDDVPETDSVAALRHRLVVSAILTVPVIAMAMIPALQFTNWQWLSLTLAAPVVVWGAWPFHRAAWINLRHGTSTMDTLVSLGTLLPWDGRSTPCSGERRVNRGWSTRSSSPSRGATAAATSISRPRPVSRRSSSPDATSSNDRSDAQAPPCVPCSNSVPRTSRPRTGRDHRDPGSGGAVGSRGSVRRTAG